MLFHREQYLSHMLFEGSEREWFSELFGPLKQLEDEWRAQKMPEEQIGMTAFDWDYVKTVPLAVDTGPRTGIKPVILKDTETEQLAIDNLGRHARLIKTSATIALPMDFPLQEPEDWERIRPWFLFHEDRLDRETLRAQKKLWEAGCLSILSVPGAFDILRELMGEVTACVFYYEEPELIREILSAIADTAEAVILRTAEIVPIDCLFFHEDMAGKAGPMIGPNIIREFSGAYYRRLTEAARSTGTRMFSMDSDGDVSPILEELILHGINCIFPCEPVGGMDVVALRKKYGQKISFKGGIDKHVLLKTKEDIRRELEYRLDPCLFGGGMIFGLDHRIPNGVSPENYRYYVTLGREILGLPPIGDKRGWGRMAF